MIYRSRYDNIIFEFSLPQESLGVVVICDGIPSVPKQKDLMMLLNGYGYVAVYPRYQGTWESGGEFLAQAPGDDINTVIKIIKNGLLTELYAGKDFAVKKPIYLIGSSFGGSVALSIIDNMDIDKIIAFSPIIDFQNYNKEGEEQDLLLLESFIQNAFNMGYRFSDINWKKMVKGEIFNPIQDIDPLRASNVLVVYDLFDKEIGYRKIKEYCTKNNIETITTQGIGHLSFSKIPGSIWEEAIKFLGYR